MPNTDGNKTVHLLPSLKDRETSPGGSEDEPSFGMGGSEVNGQEGGTVRRSTRLRRQGQHPAQKLVAGFLSSGKTEKAQTSKGPSSTRKGSGGGRVAKVRGGQEYRVQGLEAVRHRLGQPIEFKVNWVQTWIPFHDLRGEEPFQEARDMLTEELGYKTWDAHDGPGSHQEVVDLKEEVEYESGSE